MKRIQIHPGEQVEILFDGHPERLTIENGGPEAAFQVSVILRKEDDDPLPECLYISD